jgi:cell wall-associated NlpC family hydrolase
VSEEPKGQVPEAGPITAFLAKKIAGTAAKKEEVQQVQMAEAIGEIELETQILGASFIKVHVIDPELIFLNQGWLQMKEGLLEPIEVEFPEKSKWLWILCAIEPSTDVTSANLELTFESKVVSTMREFWTPPKQAPPGTQTRAEFVRDLLIEAKVHYKIGELKVVQPLAEEEKGESGATQVKAALEEQRAEQATEKTPGVSSGTNIKIKGIAPTKQQQADINTALGVAHKLKAPPLAVEALFCAGIGESDFKRESSNASGHNGIWQSSTIPGSEVELQATYFLKGGESFQAGGAIKLANEGKAPGEIATLVEASGEPASFYEAYRSEAKAIIQAGGGTAATETGAAESDVAQLTRGTASNPDEDTFECITRLAQQVNWFAFTSATFGKPEIVYYITGPQLAKQHPAAYVDIQENYCINRETGVKQEGVVLSPTTGTIDNTTFEYRKTHKVKTRVQRRSKAAKPSTPSEIRLELVCGIADYRAGDVFVIRGFGPFNGRWIVSDATRNCLKDTFTKFILEPPIEPLPEPLATEKGAELTGQSGKGEGAALQAERALSETSKYRYSEESNRSNNGTLFGPEPRTMDCSSFFTLCYKAANLPDPNGLNYNPIGTTETLIRHMKKTSTPKPGDACLFGSSETSTVHVQIYIGGGKAISEGVPGKGPEAVTANAGPATFLGYYEP